MAGLQLSGLASGMDTDSIITQLMAIESQPRTRMAQQQLIVQTRQSALQSVDSSLSNLKLAAQDLRSAALWIPSQSASSSAESVLGAQLTGAAAPGAAVVTVQNLASSEQHTLAPTALNGTKLTITAGSATKDYTYTSIDDLVSQVNADDQGSVYAVNVNGSLVLSRRVTGAAQGFTVAVDGTAVAETIKAGQDAHYTVDGGSIQSSSSNVVANGLPGVELTLKTAGTSTVNVQPPTVDPAGVKAKIKAFVSAYNASVDLVRGKLNEKPVASPQNDSDAVQGVLYGDQALASVLAQMRQRISEAGLDSLGVTVPGTGSGTSDDALAGKLSFNEATFDDAWAKSPSAVQAKLGSTTTSGFAQSFEGLLDPITRAGDGLLDQRVNQANSDLAYIKDTLAAMDLRLQSKEDYLRAQFTAMESALAQSQSQSSWLAGQLGQSS
ncbi:MAG TPA: flagellar filament capping protein FliD [Solirubrobacteraceae bacterium]